MAISNILSPSLIATPTNPPIPCPITESTETPNPSVPTWDIPKSISLTISGDRKKKKSKKYNMVIAASAKPHNPPSLPLLSTGLTETPDSTILATPGSLSFIDKSPYCRISDAPLTPMSPLADMNSLGAPVRNGKRKFGEDDSGITAGLGCDADDKKDGKMRGKKKSIPEGRAFQISKPSRGAKRKASVPTTFANIPSQSRKYRSYRPPIDSPDRRTLYETRRESRALQADNEALRTDLRNAVRDLREEQLLVGSLRARLAESHREIRDSNDDYRAMKQKHQAKASELDNVQSSLNKLRDRCTALDRQVRTKDETEMADKKEISRLKTLNTAAVASKELLLAQKAAADRNHKALNGRLKVLQSTLAALPDVSASDQSYITSLRRSLLESKAELQKERLNNQKYRAAENRYISAAAVWEEQRTKLQDEIHRANQARDEAIAASGSKIALLNDESEKQFAELEAQMQAIDELKGEIDIKDAALISETVKAAELELQVQGLQTDKEKSHHRAEWYKTALTAKEKEYGALKVELDAIKARLTAVADQHKAIANHKDPTVILPPQNPASMLRTPLVPRRVASAPTPYNPLRDRLIDAENCLKRAERQIDVLEDIKCEKDRRIDMMDNQIRMLRQRSSRAENSLHRAEAKIGRLTIQIRQMEERESRSKERETQGSGIELSWRISKAEESRVEAVAETVAEEEAKKSDNQDAKDGADALIQALEVKTAAETLLPARDVNGQLGNPTTTMSFDNLEQFETAPTVSIELSTVREQSPSALSDSSEEEEELVEIRINEQVDETSPGGQTMDDDVMDAASESPLNGWRERSRSPSLRVDVSAEYLSRQTFGTTVTPSIEMDKRLDRATLWKDMVPDKIKIVDGQTEEEFLPSE